MRRSALVLAAVALVVGAADLAHKAHAVATHGDDLLYHERSLGYVVGVIVAAGAWCLALVATRSSGLAVAGGVLLGGVAGNALSWALWPRYDGTPNPLFVGDAHLGVAFNLADVAVVAAVFIVLPPALTVFALRNRDRLHQPVRLRR